jgi:hypothetical protein
MFPALTMKTSQEYCWGKEGEEGREQTRSSADACKRRMTNRNFMSNVCNLLIDFN